jgi:hypothetical protein
LHANVGDIIGKKNTAILEFEATGCEIEKKRADWITEYRFYPQNHSVARAAFTQPCIPYEDTGPNKVGFWSEFQPVALVLSNVR